MQQPPGLLFLPLRLKKKEPCGWRRACITVLGAGRTIRSPLFRFVPGYYGLKDAGSLLVPI
ncbi:hypothetical protein BUE76_20110 [Cnuella takakiae]|nr:hypothetical protein BUE76_20110 [Cnuella takakiae]